MPRRVKLSPLGKLIRERRAELSISQVDLAKQLGMTQGMVSHREVTGHFLPHELTACLRALEVPRDQWGWYLDAASQAA